MGRHTAGVGLSHGMSVQGMILRVLLVVVLLLLMKRVAVMLISVATGEWTEDAPRPGVEGWRGGGLEGFRAIEQ